MINPDYFDENIDKHIWKFIVPDELYLFSRFCFENKDNISITYEFDDAYNGIPIIYAFLIEYEKDSLVIKTEEERYKVVINDLSFMETVEFGEQFYSKVHKHIELSNGLTESFKKLSKEEYIKNAQVVGREISSIEKEIPLKDIKYFSKSPERFGELLGKLSSFRWFIEGDKVSLEGNENLSIV